MSLTLAPDYLPLLPVVHLLSQECCGVNSRAIGTSVLTSTAWGTNNTLAVGFPMVLPVAYTVAKIGWANAATVTGTVDAGVYDEAGNRMFSVRNLNGDVNVNHAGASAVQSATVNVTLQPGRYYMFLTLSATTATVLAAPTTVAKGRGVGLIQATVSTAILASTLTFAVFNQTFVPFVGITSRSTQF